MCNHKINSLAYFLLLASFLVISAMGDSSEEKDECAAQLAGLTTCLSYVSGESKAPTPDCCSGLKQVLKTNKKCLCFIIKHRNDPDLGSLQINVTLALRLPTVCNAPTNVSKCPELLHMDPKSQEAQVFYQLNNGSSKGGTSPAPSPSGLTSGSSQASNLTQKSDAFCKEKRLFGIEILAAWLLVGLCFYWACNGII